VTFIHTFEKKHLHSGVIFSSDTDIESDVLSWLERQDPNFYQVGVSSLPATWNKCTQTNGMKPYWPAVQCRPPDRPRARRPADSPAGSVRRRQTTTTTNDRRQRAKQYWPIRRASNKTSVCPAVLHHIQVGEVTRRDTVIPAAMQCTQVVWSWPETTARSVDARKTFDKHVSARCSYGRSRLDIDWLFSILHRLRKAERNSRPVL